MNFDSTLIATAPVCFLAARGQTAVSATAAGYHTGMTMPVTTDGVIGAANRSKGDRAFEDPV